MQTTIRLMKDTGEKIQLRGVFPAFPDPEALDTSLPGRDVLDLFAVIVDRPGNWVCLLNQHHHYVIQQQP